MKNKDTNSSIRLTRRIFQYLLGVTLISVISLGIIWFREKFNRYNNEVTELKQSFSETEKQKIKIKILEIKDYIRWVQYNSEAPVLKTLADQVNRLNMPAINSETATEPFSEKTVQALNDSLSKSRVPVYILDAKGVIVFSYNPFSESGSTRPESRETILLDKIRKNHSENTDTLTLYERKDSSDLTLAAAGYFNKTILPGFNVVSVVRSGYLDDVLKVHLLDSINRVRFSENEYVFINSMNGKALLTHGNYNNPPIDILSFGDTAWIKIFRAQQSSARYPEGLFYTYTWPMLTSQGKAIKTSYFSYIPECEWIIGTGFYEDDVNSIIALRRKELHADMQTTIFNIVCLLLAFSLLIYLLVWLLSRHIGKNIEVFKTFFDKAAKENLLIDKSKVSYREFMFMAEAANLMVLERKQIEEALMESEAHYRYLFEQNPVPLLIYDKDSLKILSVNVAFTNHYGYSKEEALKMTLIDFLPDDEKKSVSGFKARLKDNDYSGEWHNIKKDGTRITVATDSKEFLHEGHLAKIVAINDITASKIAEEEIRNMNTSLEIKVEERTSLLESVNKELEAFSYSVSHDLRAPLRQIHGFLELLTNNCVERLDDKSRHYFGSISAAAGHMGILIDDLLNFSRTSRVEMKLDNINMNQAIKNALKDLEQETTGRTIEWTINTMPEVYADGSMIRQVWVNLLSNAIKYTRKREIAKIEIGTYSENNENIFFIRDNGAGFDMKYSNKLFGVFQRLHRREDFDGTGIGLANVHQVIKRHKGRTWAEGEVDKGATFYFSLPGKPIRIQEP